MLALEERARALVKKGLRMKRVTLRSAIGRCSTETSLLPDRCSREAASCPPKPVPDVSQNLVKVASANRLSAGFLLDKLHAWEYCSRLRGSISDRRSVV